MLKEIMMTASCGFMGVVFFVSRSNVRNCETVGVAHACEVGTCGLQVVPGEVEVFSSQAAMNFCRRLEAEMKAGRDKVVRLVEGDIVSWVLPADEAGVSVRGELLALWGEVVAAVG